MLLKLLVLVGLAIYFFNAGEPGLTFLALTSLIPTLGLLLAIMLVVILVVKGWYGSAVILAVLIAFNLIGNKLLEKRDLPPTDNLPPR